MTPLILSQMDAGRVVEFDAPLTLLTDETSAFSGLAKASNQYDALKELAAKKS